MPVNPIQSALATTQSQDTQKTQLNTPPKTNNTTNTNKAAVLPQDQVTIGTTARQAQAQTLQAQQAKPSFSTNNDTDQYTEGH